MEKKEGFVGAIAYLVVGIIILVVGVLCNKLIPTESAVCLAFYFLIGTGTVVALLGICGIVAPEKN